MASGANWEVGRRDGGEEIVIGNQIVGSCRECLRTEGCQGPGESGGHNEIVIEQTEGADKGVLPPL